jgi:hypothetical protein
MRILTRRPSARRMVGAAIILVLVFASSCQPAQPPRSRTVSQRDYPTPTHQLNLPGQVVFAPGDGSLWLQNANGSNTHVLVKSTGESYAESPAFSPDGKRVAYAVQAYTQNGEMLEDIRVVNLDGKKKEESPGRKNETLRFAQGDKPAVCRELRCCGRRSGRTAPRRRGDSRRFVRQ